MIQTKGLQEAGENRMPCRMGSGVLYAERGNTLTLPQASIINYQSNENLLDPMIDPIGPFGLV